MTANNVEGKQSFPQPRVVVVDSFEYELKVTKSEGGKEFLEIPIFINKKPITQYLGRLKTVLNFYQLKKSLVPSKKNLFIFTCSCGVEACGFWYNGIQVTKKDGKITWLINELVSEFKSPVSVKFVFDEKAYSRMITELGEDLIKLAKKKPDLKDITGDTKVQRLAEIAEMSLNEMQK